MAGYVYVNGAWRSVQKGFLYAGGAWRSVQKGFLYAGGAWKQFFSSAAIPSIAQQVTISQSTNASTGLITLTGTNFRWTNFSSGTYSFQKSTDQSFWSTISSGSITNPSVGSSNTRSYQLSQSDLTANSANYFRFVVVVTSSTNNSGTSISSNELVQMPRDITNLTVTSSTYTPATNNYVINLSWTASQYSGSQELQYKLASSSIWSTWLAYDGSTTSAGVGGLNGGGVSYNFRILPYTSSSSTGYFGNYSNTATGSTYVAKPPNNPTSLSTSNVTTNSLTFSWNAPSVDSSHNAATSYLYNYNTTGATPTGGFSTTSTSVNISGLSSSTTYYLFVLARNDDGDSSWVSTTATTQTPIITPGIPTNLTHSKSYSYISNSLANFLTVVSGSGGSQKLQQWNYQTNVRYAVSWSAGSNAASYDISVSPNTTNSGNVYANTSSTSYNFDATQISQNTITWYIWVRSKSSDGTTSNWVGPTGGTSVATVTSTWNLRLWRCDGSTFSSATATSTSLSRTWTGVNTSFTHYSDISGTIAGSSASAVSAGCV